MKTGAEFQVGTTICSLEESVESMRKGQHNKNKNYNKLDQNINHPLQDNSKITYRWQDLNEIDDRPNRGYTGQDDQDVD